MIEQSIIPKGFVPSYECWKWLHSEHRRVLQLEREAYDKACKSGNFESLHIWQTFEAILWNALMECTDIQHKATDKLIAETKAMLAAMSEPTPEHLDYSGIPF